MYKNETDPNLPPERVRSTLRPLTYVFRLKNASKVDLFFKRKQRTNFKCQKLFIRKTKILKFHKKKTLL